MDFYHAAIIIMFLSIFVPMFLPLFIKSWTTIVAIIILDMLTVVAIVRHIDPSTMKF